MAVAIEMADEDGLASVTLRGIAARLAVHVTSLYNHVPTKDAVMFEMTNALIAEARLPTGRIGWEEWVRQFATGMRVLGRKHPGAFEAFHHAPATSEQAAEPFESGFAAFRAAGFDAASTYNAVKATVVAVLGYMLEDTLPARNQECHPYRRPELPDRTVSAGPCDEPCGRQDRHLRLPGRNPHRRDRGDAQRPAAPQKNAIRLTDLVAEPR